MLVNQSGLSSHSFPLSLQGKQLGTSDGSLVGETRAAAAERIAMIGGAVATRPVARIRWFHPDAGKRKAEGGKRAARGGELRDVGLWAVGGGRWAAFQGLGRSGVRVPTAGTAAARTAAAAAGDCVSVGWAIKW